MANIDNGNVVIEEMRLSLINERKEMQICWSKVAGQ